MRPDQRLLFRKESCPQCASLKTIRSKRQNTAYVPKQEGISLLFTSAGSNAGCLIDWWKAYGCGWS